MRSRVMVQPALRNPVNAARMLCSCHPVAAISSGMALPSGRRLADSLAALGDPDSEQAVRRVAPPLV